MRWFAACPPRVGDRHAQIWECGFDTFTCCQDVGESNVDWPQRLPHMEEWVESRRGWTLIGFLVDSSLAFLSAVANADLRDAFYVRMTHWAAPDVRDVTVKPMESAMFQEELASRFHLQLLQVSFPGTTCRN
ncbi:hypothetical protein GPZ77_33960 [Streptomyces sp. QHH-9511]|uniref:hypothetical protein n=1 Tax=Streptomyces sp. QHH-9511 TaxID=2684468 RepID=UPI0013193013|nr:hypothetical protein [Streptomyces sp. QHH-9511]QGZ52631.1 hypothetical protein GPZ77_33960 [Streptomyces sp. QHH-9511]